MALADPAAQSLLVLALMCAGFVTERLPPAVIAACGAAAYLVLGLVTTSEALDVFSNPALITIGAMFVLSGSLVRTGTLDSLANRAVAIAATRPRTAVAAVLGTAFVASGFLSNTAVVLVLIPVVLRVAPVLGAPANRLLIPLSYVSILGGTCTLLGTSTSLLIDGMARERGFEGLGIFDVTGIGLVASAAGMLFLATLGRSLLPRRAAGPAGPQSEPMYLTELTLRADDRFIGRSPLAIDDLKRPSVQLRGVRRGNRIQRDELDAWSLEKGDAILMLATAPEVATFAERATSELGLRRGLQQSRPTEIVEAVVAARGASQHRLLADLGLASRYGFAVLGVHRHRHTPGPSLQALRLRSADRLLLEGPPEAMHEMAEASDLIPIARASVRPFRRSRAPIALVALLGVVVLAAFDVMPIAGLAIVAVAAILASRCIDADEVWDSIDGSVIFLIVSMLIVGRGLETSGAIESIVAAIEPALSAHGMLWTLLALYALTSLLTEVISNTAVAVIMTPLALGLASALGTDARPLVLAVLFGASASFATPIGYQTNALVYSAGGYRFLEFLRIGVPMNVVVGVATTLAIWLSSRVAWL